MTQSMTAFARESIEQDWGSLTWELRSVNHRYLDLTIKLPEELRGIENSLRQILGESLKRGKLECQLKYRPNPSLNPEIRVNESNAEAVLKACKVVNKRLHQPSEINALEVLKWPGVIEESESDLQPVLDAALASFKDCLKWLCESRASEGARLQVMIEERCATMLEIVAGLKKNRQSNIEAVREKMRKRVKELEANIDNERFEQEVVYLLQKMDIDEELDRINSHFSEIENSFKKPEAIGRRLDFLMQELNREANTLGSKSASIETSQAAVELKVLIEQMREQVQNIE